MIYTMKFLLNICIVWTHELISEDELDKSWNKWFHFAKLFLTIDFIAGWFTGTFGVLCDREHMPKGIMVMSGF